MFAQVTPAAPAVPTSGDFWNPNNWSTFVGSVGVPAFMCLVLLAVVVVFVWKALGKWDRHLSRSEVLAASQLVLCRQVHAGGGAANVVDLREAGHDFADSLLEIARGIDEKTADALKPHIDRIHQTLRTVPPPLAAGPMDPA